MKPIENKNYLSITQETSIRAKLVCIVLLLIVGLLSTAFGMESQDEAEESGSLSGNFKIEAYRNLLPRILPKGAIQPLTISEIVAKVETALAEKAIPRQALIDIICQIFSEEQIPCSREAIQQCLTAKYQTSSQRFHRVAKATSFKVTRQGLTPKEWSEKYGDPSSR